jgi:Domain of unknown function (DUF4349)
MRQHVLRGLVIAMVLVSACNAQKRADTPRETAAAAAASEVTDHAALADAQAAAPPPSFRYEEARSMAAAFKPADMSQPSPEPVPVPDDRKLVRRGEMTLEVRSVVDAMERLIPLVSSMGGHTANRSERQNEYGTHSASITCRIPADRLDAAIESVKALGLLQALTLSADDITAAYFDVHVRIETQKALENRLVALLQRPTNKLSELLEIEREVARVREEIDRLEGRKRLWDNQVELSSLVITLEEPAPVVAGTGGGFLQTLTQAFGQSAENFVLAIAGIIAGVGSILPMATIVAAAAWAFFRWRRRQVSVA